MLEQHMVVLKILLLIAFSKSGTGALLPTPDALVWEPPARVEPDDPTVEIWYSPSEDVSQIDTYARQLPRNESYFFTCLVRIAPTCYRVVYFRARRPGYDFGNWTSRVVTVNMNLTVVPPSIYLDHPAPLSNATVRLIDVNSVPFSIIKYTTDGSPVTFQSPDYESPLQFSTAGNHTVRSAEVIYTPRGIISDWAISAETSITFEIISQQLVAPQVDPPSGIYDARLNVSALCSDAGAQAFNSVDNQTFAAADTLELSVPRPLNAQVFQEISVSSQCRAAGRMSSAISQRTYILRAHQEPSPIVMNPAAGLYTVSQFRPTVTCEPTASCRIYCTTDASQPAVIFDAAGVVTPVNTTRLYTGQISVGLGTHLLSCINVDAGWYSPRSYRLYSIQGELSDPVFYPVSGTSALDTVTVSISSAEAAQIYFYLETNTSGPPGAFDFGPQWIRGSAVQINASATLHVMLQKLNYAPTSATSFTSMYIVQPSAVIEPEVPVDWRYFLALTSLLLVPLVIIAALCFRRKKEDRNHVDQFITMGFDIEPIE